MGAADRQCYNRKQRPMQAPLCVVHTNCSPNDKQIHFYYSDRMSNKYLMRRMMRVANAQTSRTTAPSKATSTVRPNSRFVPHSLTVSHCKLLSVSLGKWLLSFARCSPGQLERMMRPQGIRFNFDDRPEIRRWNSVRPLMRSAFVATTTNIGWLHWFRTHGPVHHGIESKCKHK